MQIIAKRQAPIMTPTRFVQLSQYCGWDFFSNFLYTMSFFDHFKVVALKVTSRNYNGLAAKLQHLKCDESLGA